MDLDYRVLGPLEVWADGHRLDIGGARQRRLLGALVLAEGHPVTAERLIDILWLGDPPDRARNTLRTYIARARRALEVSGAAPLLTDAHGWSLERAADAVDSSRFESLLATARALSTDPSAALGTLEEALALWRDDALVEFDGEDWCTGEAVRLNELRLVAQEERFEAMLDCGLYDDSIAELGRFTDRHPLRDRPRGQQMVALYRAGRQVEAVRLFQNYRSYLDAELGLEPSDELSALEQQIISRDPTLRQMTPARRQLGAYRLGQQIGHSPFGMIYRATQPALAREVAIQVVRSDVADDPEFIRRFDADARKVARLEHPHVVPLFDYWREPGAAYLVMRYLAGGTLEQVLAARPPSTGTALRVVEEVGAALAAAHSQGVVHGALGAANILFDDHGVSFLGHFGIATRVGPPSTSEDGAITVDRYLSPERIQTGEATIGADIYAFGVLLFELFVGPTSRPETAGPDLPGGIHARRPSRLSHLRPDLPEALDEVIDRATATNPQDRFGDIGALVSAVQVALAPSLGSQSSVPPGFRMRNPYKGLAAFDEADAADFFGRERLVDRLVDQSRRSRFVAVVGPSGSGKSSLVRAGLAPRLHEAGAHVISLTPGRHPMNELTRSLLTMAPARRATAILDALGSTGGGLAEAAANNLPDGATQLVLIVDQFEELFTLTDGDEREDFLAAITNAAGDAAGRILVVITLRADFYDRPLAHRSISELVQANTTAVTPLSAQELERAITGPARRVGLPVEPSLVAALIGDASSAPAPLPLIQFQLARLFDDDGRDGLSLASYQRHGGLSGAVARRADELYDGYDERRRDDVRRLFGRLVVPGEGSDDTRRRVMRSEYVNISPEVIAAYGEARLLTFDHDPTTREPTVEVAHEALIREWPRLRRWLDADRESLRITRHVAAATEAWAGAGRDADELYRGGRLETVEELVKAHPDLLNERERSFVAASATARDEAREAQQRRYREQTRANRRLRRLLIGVGALAIAALAAGLFAFQQRRRADAQAAEADFDRLIALTRTLPEQDLQLAMLAAVEAFDRDDRAETRGALHRALMAEPRFDGRIENVGAVRATTEGPDGAWIFSSRILSGDERTEGTWYHSETLETIGSVVIEGRWSLTSSPDRSVIAARWLARAGDAENDPRSTEVRLHDRTGGLLGMLPTTGAAGVIRFLADDRLIVSDGAGLTIWDLETRTAAATIAIPGAPRLESADVSSDGSLMIVSSPAWALGTVWLIDLEAARIVPGTVGRCRASCIVRFDPSDGRVAVDEPDGVVIRNVTTWDVETTLSTDGPDEAGLLVLGDLDVIAPRDQAHAAGFSTDGATLHIGTTEGSLAFFDARTGEPSAPTIDGRGNPLISITTTPDDTLITVSDRGLVERWKPDRSGPFGIRLGDGDGLGAFAPDGAVFVSANDPAMGWVTIYEPASGRVLRTVELEAGTPLGTITFSADGRWVAVALLPGRLVLYEVPSFEATTTIDIDGFAFAAFSPDGSRLAVSFSSTRDARLSRHGAIPPLRRETDPGFGVNLLQIDADAFTPLSLDSDFDGAGRPRWNPDGTQVAISDLAGSDAIFDAETGLQLGTRLSGQGPNQGRDLLWEPDGVHLLGVGDSGISRWNMSTGEIAAPFKEFTSGQWITGTADATLLVTSSETGQARLWDLEAGLPVGASFPDPGLTWVADGNLPPMPALSADGGYLALSGGNGTILWSLDPFLWRDRACELAGRNMTRDEWSNLIGNRAYRATCDQWPSG